MRVLSTATTGVLTVAALAFLFGGTAQAADDKNCSDFATQQEAQAYLASTPGDPSNLDSDDDGIACETLTSGGTTQAASEDGTTTGTTTQITRRPQGAIAAGDGSSSDGGSLRYVVGGVALTAAGGAAFAARRSSRATA